jgi:poly-gamma-glutamate synthesis protein (capsule biosynthesis protein)
MVVGQRRQCLDNTEAAEIDVCSLANNHVLDWGYSGLRETLDSLNGANIKIVGAGINLFEAQIPAVKEVPSKGRVVVFAFGLGTSGVPSSWRALDKRPGINRLRDLSDKSLLDIQKRFGKSNAWEISLWFQYTGELIGDTQFLETKWFLHTD